MAVGKPKDIAGRWGILGIIIVVVAFLFEGEKLGLFNLGITTMTPSSVGTYYEVTRVVDGDTLRIEIDGTDESVRLIGINTPETVDPRKTVECFGLEASERMKELADGEIVRLEYDDSQGSRDGYGRILAYVYLENGEMINRKMIAEGYAYEYTYLAPYKYRKEFRELQNIARTSERGLWNENACGEEN